MRSQGLIVVVAMALGACSASPLVTPQETVEVGRPVAFPDTVRVVDEGDALAAVVAVVPLTPAQGLKVDDPWRNGFDYFVSWLASTCARHQVLTVNRQGAKVTLSLVRGSETTESADGFCSDVGKKHTLRLTFREQLAVDDIETVVVDLDQEPEEPG